MKLSDSLVAAIDLIRGGDPQVVAAVTVSLQVALVATAFSSIFGLGLGFAVASRQFRGRRLVEILLNTSTAMPTVVVGLLTYAVLSRRGLLGDFGLLYSPTAMIIGQTILITPLIAALATAVIGGADPRIHQTALTLGASRVRAAITVCAELRTGLLAAVATGFGRLISELGIALMVGGNIEGVTRTMTTAIALETSKGDFALGLALGLILMLVALTVNAAVVVSGGALTRDRPER